MSLHVLLSKGKFFISNPHVLVNVNIGYVSMLPLLKIPANKTKKNNKIKKLK